jgi:putative acetyltransferase
MTITLRPYLPTDTELLAILMQASIVELCVDDYDEDQRIAWCATAEDTQSFAKMLASNLTLVALDDENDPVGFTVLVKNRAVTHVYVHPDLIASHIGQTLVEALAKLALARGGDMLIADATDNAKGFFEKLGFVATARNTINYGDVWLGATTMEKPLRVPTEATVQ